MLTAGPQDVSAEFRFGADVIQLDVIRPYVCRHVMWPVGSGGLCYSYATLGEDPVATYSMYWKQRRTWIPGIPITPAYLSGLL